MKKITLLSTLLLSVLTYAQCPLGQSEVTIDIETDSYGYEIYWELVPTGNSCGNGTIFAGGNALVGCNGGSVQTQNPGGYGDNITIPEGPWCLTDGASYDIIFVDDWGDGGAAYTIYIDGYPVYEWSGGNGAGTGSVYTFVITPPLAYDMEGHAIHTFNYVNIGNVDITGELFNRSTNTLTDISINYQIDNGPVISSPYSGLSILPFSEYTFVHPTLWNAASNGTYNLKIWASDLNGNADMDNTNDTVQKSVVVGPGIPNLIDGYVGITPLQTVIANSDEGILVPRDLDFHPTLSNYELWVILKSTEGTGGQTVKISNAGLGGQTELVQQDGNANHFMSLPTGIAFSENGNFSTSPGVFDANHNGGDPFTGPTLWSSDPAIYAQPSGGNGSHLDMLHESPFSMGVAHESDNVFWVNDGNNNCVTRYDFKEDHGPGNDDHSDGIVRRYSGLGLIEDPDHHVASHLVLDKTTNWLYIVDSENDRVLRLDITSGSQTGTFSPYEVGIAESSVYGGYIVSDYITSGLTEPSGIDLIGNRMIVSDFATGEIVIYDITGSTGVELSRIQTFNPGVMGVKIGPDGKIWYVNATTNEVVRLDFIDVTGIDEINHDFAVTIYPNPSSGSEINISTNISGNYSLKIKNIAGQLISDLSFNATNSIIDISTLASGSYFVQIVDQITGNELNKKFIVTR